MKRRKGFFTGFLFFGPTCTKKVKSNINWNKREDELLKLLDKYRKNNGDYDCIIPVSGGKDSTWQIFKCLSLGLKPLAISWKPHLRTKIGYKNLNNLKNLGVDHMDITTNPKIEKKILLETFKRKGTTRVYRCCSNRWSTERRWQKK